MENNKDSIVICPGAQVIGDVELGEDVSIWHGAVVSEGKDFPENSLILGVPAKLVKQLSDEQVQMIQNNADNYVKLSKQYKED